VVDLTALPEDATPTDPTATDLAPKVKSVQITALTPPPSDKVPADAAQADGTVTEKVNGEANGDVNRDSGKPVKAALRQVATIAPMIPIPEPATGPTERDAKDVVAQKTASAGQPRQLADDNPREFFAPKVTIDWNTVLKPSASYSSPAAENKAAKPGKGDKPKSLADSGQEALTALAAKEGLIEPLQLGLLAYRARDYKTAIKYWLPMAHEGKSRAQFYMGGLYHDGTGVERDMVQAYMWWSLAAAKGYNPALTARDRLRDDMTDVEVAEAMNLVRTWRPVSE